MTDTDIKTCALLIQDQIKALRISPVQLHSPEQEPRLVEKIQSIVDQHAGPLAEPKRLRLHREFFELGPIHELIDDSQVTEIMINDFDKIYFETNGRLQKHSDHFLNEVTFANAVQRVFLQSGMNPNLERPFANGAWKGWRVHAVAAPIGLGKHTLTLRRHPEVAWSLASLAEAAWATGHEIEKLKALVAGANNFLILGPTGSGKTSVLNACLQAAQDNERCALIEDTSELKAPNAVSFKLLTRHDSQGILPAIQLSDLVREALRMRPDRIIMGEIRGPEAKDLLLAFATGHRGCMGTLHADSAQQALLRLEMLVQLGAGQWNTQSVRQLIRLSLSHLVVVKKDSTGHRKLDGIFKINSLEEFGFLLEKI